MIGAAQFETVCLNPVEQTLALCGLQNIAPNCTHMLRPNYGTNQGKRHCLNISGVWIDQCPLTAGSMAATGEITGGSQSISVAGTVESFSVIWNNSGLPVVAFSIGFNRSLTAGERTALSSTAFWALLFAGTVINTANCTALYPWLAPMYQSLVGWWDASAITALANDDPCGTWSDRSGLGNHVSQAVVASLKPTYKTNQQNSLPALSFDNGDWLSNDAIAAYFTGVNKPCTTAAVFKRSDAEDDYAVVCGGATATPILFNLALASSNEINLFRRADDSTLVNPAAGTTSTNPRIAEIRYGAATADAWLNGTKIHNGVACAVGDTTLVKFTIGAWRFDVAAIGNYYNGLIMEILMYRSAVLDADLSAIRAYHSAKWGIAVA
jgi:hypothetical protein